MDFEKKQPAFNPADKGGEENNTDEKSEFDVKVDLDDIIEALIALDRTDQEKVYEALCKALGKTLDGESKKMNEPKKEEAPMNAQDIAKSFM